MTGVCTVAYVTWDKTHLGKIGVWWSGSWKPPEEDGVEPARELESAGYGAFWSSGGFKPGLSERFDRLLGATDRAIVASGIVNIWLTEAQDLASAFHQLDRLHPGRFLLGLGASHAPLVDGYSRPYEKMVGYLDALDASRPPVPKERRLLAALRPRMLELSASRAAGAHPYLVPVEHTFRARRVLGEGPILAPEVTVVPESDPSKARALGRRFASGYLALPNYVNNLRSLGFDDDDLAAGGSDRLIDALVVWGDLEAIGTRVREHLEAGADHVCVQVLAPFEGFPLAQYKDLASALATERQSPNGLT